MSLNRNNIMFLVVVLLSACSSPSHTVVIYHTSDIHGGITSQSAWWNKAAPQRKIGGLAALSALVKKEKHPYLLLDSGDIFQGTPEGNLTRGKAVVAAMNAVGYHASTVGNHEFDYGEANLIALTQQAQFPFLAANIRRKTDLKPVTYTRPTLMIDVGGLKVGLVGIATRHTKTSTLPEHVAHLIFDDEAKAAKHNADALRKAGANIVIALSHCGLTPRLARKRVKASSVQLGPRDLAYKGDVYIARNAAVDIVLGGHMHVGLDQPWRDPVSGTYIVQSYDNLQSVSRIVVTLSGKALTVNGQLIDLWIDETGEDNAVLQVIAPFQKTVSESLDKSIGATNADLMRAPFELDNPLGNWMTDAMRSVAKADIAIQNTYGIRADLRKGTISLRDLYKVMPFDNTLVVAQLSGTEVLKLLRGGLKGGKSALQISGAKVGVQWDKDKQEPTQLRVHIQDKALELTKVYTVATNNYLAQGGSGAGPLATAPSKDTQLHLRTIITQYLKRNSPITPVETGRFYELK